MENMNRPGYSNGKIYFVEIPSTDINTSSIFYKHVFGWEIHQGSDGHIEFEDTKGGVSGTWVIGLKPATTPGFLIHMMVDDVASTIELVTANGGKLVQPVDNSVPEITARCSDPAGNIFGLYQQASIEVK